MSNMCDINGDYRGLSGRRLNLSNFDNLDATDILIGMRLCKYKFKNLKFEN